MKTANPTTIEITDLVKDIKGKRIIDHVNLHLESGKITGLKGVNGSGKTMLMRLVCGLITPTSGSIVINGKRLGKDITFPESVGILIGFARPLPGWAWTPTTRRSTGNTLWA